MARSDSESGSKIGRILRGKRARVVVNADGILGVNADPIPYAKELHSKMDYFGAFTVVHSIIELWMEKCFGAYARLKLGPGHLSRIAKTDLRYHCLADILFRLGLIDEELSKQIRQFDSTRNRIVHRLAKYSWDTKQRNRITREEADQEFSKGIDIAERLKELTNDLTQATLNQLTYPSQLNTASDPPAK